MTSTNDCWLYAGTVDKTGGYGYISGKPAHRVMYESEVGIIPAGLQLDHLCRVRSCINPAHLEPVTQKENVLRGVGLTAVNARKTVCKYGHTIDTVNINGYRQCKTCTARRSREYYHRQKIGKL